MPGRVLNFTGEPIAVYGPNDGSGSTHDNKRYLLPNGRQTPSAGWDCDGVFVPSDREARRLILPNRPGPVAVKFVDWQTFVVVRKSEKGGKVSYSMPLDFGSWDPTKSQCPSNFPFHVCWEIPNESTGDVLGLPTVPGHEAAKCPWFLSFTGIQRIDRLLAGDLSAPSIASGDTDMASVEFVQELLRGHRALSQASKNQKVFRNVPGRKSWKSAPGGETFGTFGTRTAAAVAAFKSLLGEKWGFALPPTTTVDGNTLRALLLEPHSTPGAGRGYLMCLLNQPFTIWEKMISLISTHEESPTKGGFAAQSPPGMDKAGLSFGLLQWTHRSKRLATLLKRFRDRAPAAFRRTFKVPGTTLTELVTHAENPESRLDANGNTLPAFQAYDLFSTRWRARFHEAGLSLPLQRLQIELAVEDIQAEFRFMKIASATAGSGYAKQLQSERAVGFWLDLVNQIGPGNPSSTSHKGGYWRYKEVLTALGIAESAPYDKANEKRIMDKVVEDSSFVERREYYRDRAPLSDDNEFPPP